MDTAGDGVDAWAALQDNEFHLLVTDYQMPHLNGAELIRKVRQANMRLPIILVSSLVGVIPNTDLPWLQCSAMLGKPFTAKELVSVVRESLHFSSKHNDCAVRL